MIRYTEIWDTFFALHLWLLVSAKDIFHEAVKVALQNDGWTITHDPLTIDLVDRQLQVDLGAEQEVIVQWRD